MRIPSRSTLSSKKVLGIAAGSALAGGAVVFALGQALASGIPATNALTYSGFLEDGTGVPITGSRAIAVEIWSAATGGNKLCERVSTATDVTGGRFSVPLPDTCTDTVKANPDLWVQVAVAGSALGRTKLGAVPYAVEAGHAVSATTADTANAAGGALQTTLSALDAKSTLSSLITMAGPNLGDTRLNSSVIAAATWTPVPNRSVDFTKKYAASKLRITYQDTLGDLGAYYQGCQWRILLDGAEVLDFSDADLDGAGSWRMSNAAHVAWATAGAGAHNVTVEWMGGHRDGVWNTYTSGTQECLAGWNTTGNFLSVEELP